MANVPPNELTPGRVPPLPAEILALPGRSILQSLEALAAILRILRTNTDELLQWLARTDDPYVILQLWDLANRPGLDDFLDESNRRIFNFVAAANARVDYYHALKNRGHLDGALERDYKNRVGKAFITDGPSQWIKGLRNHMLHHRLPTTMANFQVVDRAKGTPGGVTSRIIIPTEDLLTSDSFNATAKQWMATQDDIDLRVVVVDHTAALDTFDTWFGPAYAEHHLEECETYRRAADEAVRQHQTLMDLVDRYARDHPPSQQS